MRSGLNTGLFPNTRISATKDSELEFATTLGGNRLATSVGGTLTGRGGNVILIDDPTKPQDAASQVARENTKQWFANTLLSRLDNKTNDAIVVVMQRLHEDDLVGYLLEHEGWVHLNLPAIAECEQRIALSATRFHVRQPGDVLHPEREPRGVLDELKRSMGSLAFAAQYQQEPIAEGGNLVKWDWFQFYDKPPARNSQDQIIVSWDTALSAKELAVRSGHFSNAHINALVQLLKRGFDLIEPGSVIEPEESVNLLPVPSELTGELGARHIPLAQRHVENRLERRQERQFYPNTLAPLHLSLSGRPR
jgi:hypothetical protein